MGDARIYAAGLNPMEPASGKVELDFMQQVGGLPRESLIRFYELLARNLTVNVRSIWSGELLSDSQKVKRMKWLNEVRQSIVSNSPALRMNRNEQSEAETWAMMQHDVSLCPAIGAEVAIATIESYQIVDRLRGAA